MNTTHHFPTDTYKKITVKTYIDATVVYKVGFPLNLL